MLARAEFSSETGERANYCSCSLVTKDPRSHWLSVGGCTQLGAAACGFLSFDLFTTWLLICSRPGTHTLLAYSLSCIKGSCASPHSGASPVRNSKSTD